MDRPPAYPLGVCRVCRSSPCTPMFALNGYQIERCQKCEFVQVRNEPDQKVLKCVYDALHIKHLKYRDKAAAIHENKRRVALARRYVAQGESVLDAGCATGDFLVEANATFRMSGFDISARAIDVAKERVPDLVGRLWAGDLAELVQRSETYQAICLWDVIEHIWDPVSTICLLLDRVRPGGVLIMSTPDCGAFTAKIMGKFWAFMIPPDHLSLFAKKTFRYIFENIQKDEIIYHVSQGKHTNLAFLVYKLERMVGRAFPRGLMNWIAASQLGRTLIYVPTGDIQYLVVRKSA